MILRTRVPTVALAAVNFMLLAPARVLAAGAAPAGKGEATPLDLPSQSSHLDSTTSGGGSVVRTVVGLAIVIAVIYGLTWVMRQVKASREERSFGSTLSSAAVVPLGPNRSLHLIRAGRELVLVGVAEHGVTPIRTYSEQEAATLGLLADEDDDTDRPVRRRPPRGGAGGPSSRGGLVADLLERLRRLTVRS
jgi:flagellar protein FliO/FliZ